jgi:hypothetical protein
MPRLFDRLLEVAAVELAVRLEGVGAIPWSAFVLNPRRLRGSDFLMRWSQGRWSEDVLIAAVRQTERFVAIPYGPSSTAPDHDVQAFEQYFERLERANPTAQKRPDVLILGADDFNQIEHELSTIGGGPPHYSDLPFVEETRLQFLLEKTLLAVECENSLWVCRQMPAFNANLRPMRRLGGKLGLPKSAVIPTVIVKDEDRLRLKAWQRLHRVPIHIWHVFYDLGYAAALDTIEALIGTGELLPRQQMFQGPGGQSQIKLTYNLPYYKAYPLCETVETARLKADCITDKNGHVLPFVRFEGGKLVLLPEAVQMLEGVSRAQAARP